MDISQQLIESISEDLHIKRDKDEREVDWIVRVIYSAIAKNAYCSLWDQQDEETSITHFKKRCNEQLLSYIRIYPKLKKVVSSPEIVKEYVDYIYDLYLKTGFLLHKKNYVTNSKRKAITIDNCKLVRSPEPGEDLFMSGLGYYMFSDLMEYQEDIRDVFHLSKLSLSEYLDKLHQRQVFKSLESHSDIDYLRLEPPFSKGYWKKQKDINKLSLLRIGQPGMYIYYLYKATDNKILASRLPEWMCGDGKYRMISWGLLKKYQQATDIEYVISGDLVYVHLNYLLPINEQLFFELFSWPGNITTMSGFNRTMDINIFRIMKAEFENIGFRFSERNR